MIIALTLKHMIKRSKLTESYKLVCLRFQKSSSEDFRESESTVFEPKITTFKNQTVWLIHVAQKIKLI